MSYCENQENSLLRDWTIRLFCHWLTQSACQSSRNMSIGNSGVPVFLENTPNGMCEQILWLVKHSGLNFNLKETPYSLDINLKKRFSTPWNQSFGNPVPNQTAPQIFSHPRQFKENKDTLAAKDNPSELFHQQLDSLRTELKEALDNKDSAVNDFFELNKAHKKLSKENKELLHRHEQVCSELKYLKSDQDDIMKENNSLSVALKASKKDLQQSLEKFEVERSTYIIELEKLNKFKIERNAELKAARKAEKKSRQKAKKQAQRKAEKVDEKDTNTKVTDDTNTVDNTPDETNKAIGNSEHSNQFDDNLEDKTENLFETQTNCSKDTNNNKTVQSKPSESYTFKSDHPRFLDFPERFEDWSEDQKKDAYDNYFKLYLQKSLKVYY